MKYSIKITYSDGVISYLSHKDKTAWCKATAKKYMAEWFNRFGQKTTAELEPAESYQY